MVRKLFLIGTCIGALAVSGCSTTGNMERNALIGAGLGAGAGAIIGNNTGSGDASTGALIGGIVGGAGGAYTGYVQDQRYNYYQQPQPYYYNRGNDYRRPQLYFDQRYRRYYYIDPYNGRTYWQNGQYRY